jgi:flagellar biosynthesis protein
MDPFVPDEPDNESKPQQRQAAIAIKGTDADHVGAPRGDAAPRIVAKGHGEVAEQILQLAFATGVKVREDANLAEILEAIEIDTEVPLHALAAVAEILSYVYRANDISAGRTPTNP